MVVVLIFATAIRVINNLELPLYVDEAIHIVRSHLVLRGTFFAGVDQNKWLFGPFLALFNPTGPEAPFIARYLNAIMGVLILAVVVKLGLQLHSRRVGVVAGLFYAVLPLAVFHERQANVDILMGLFSTLSVLITLVMIKRPTIWLSLLLGLTLAVSRLTKAAMVGYFALPLAAIIIFVFYRGRLVNWRNIKQHTIDAWNSNANRRRTLMSLGYALGGIVLSLVVVGVIYNMAEVAGQVTRSSHTLELHNVATHLFWGRAAPGYLLKEFRKFIFVHIPFVSPTLLFLVLYAVIGSFWMKDQRQVAFLTIPALIFAFIPVFAARPGAGGDTLAARYFYADGPATAVLAAIGAEYGASWIRERVKLLNTYSLRAVHAAIVIIAFLVPLAMMTRLVISPSESRIVYPTSPFWRGYSHNDMVQTLTNAHFEAPQREFHIIVDGPLPVWLEANLGPRVAQIKAFSEDSEDEISTWLDNGSIVAVAVSSDCADWNSSFADQTTGTFYCFSLEE